MQGYARDVATRLSGRIAELGPFELLTTGDELPVFAFTLEAGVENFTVFDVSFRGSSASPSRSTTRRPARRSRTELGWAGVG